MIDIQRIRNQADLVVERLAVRHFDAREIVDNILQTDASRRDTQARLDDNLASGKQLARQIGSFMKTGEAEKALALKEETARLKEQAKELQEDLDRLIRKQQDLLVLLPNLPDEMVKPGRSADDNEVVLQHGNIPELQYAVPHWDLAREYDLVDFELGTKITGAGFPVYKGKGAALQRALIGFFLNEAISAGYTEYQPPLLVNADSAFGTGQLPDKDGQMYYVSQDELYLIPTAEVPITNLFRDTIWEERQLPLKCVAYSSCFRREAGSYGKDVRGLNRLHQFDKVEIVQVVHPDSSQQALTEMCDHVASLLRKLGLPFRMLRLCGGDMGFAASVTYDFEVYSAAQKRWLEVSSVSDFGTYQSNRMKLRFKNCEGKNALAHTLNGSALALPRILAALLENNQQENCILMPEVLHAYTGFDRINQ